VPVFIFLTNRNHGTEMHFLFMVILVLESAGKGKYDLRIVLSLEAQEIISVSN
jgi:hypothetical protein